MIGSYLACRRGARGRGKLLSLAGSAALGAGGWLGGHLSYTLGVGVTPRRPSGWVAGDGDHWGRLNNGAAAPAENPYAAKKGFFLPDATLVCWNVAGRLRRQAAQAERVTALSPDIVCLQEVIARSVQPWTEHLTEAGLGDVRVADVAAAVGRDRPLLTLVASRWEQAPVTVEDVPWPERVLAARLGGLEVVNVHSPISPKPGLAKVLTHEAVHMHLSGGRGPRLVCGDLNTPRREHPDGRVWTFARDRYGRPHAGRGERWDTAELALIKGLEGYGFRDAFRSLHGFEQREPSWVWQRWGGGYRLDHLIVSHELEVPVCGYLHQWRDEGLSDHSPLVAHIRWPSEERH